jgi:hypothetical protein
MTQSPPSLRPGRSVCLARALIQPFCSIRAGLGVLSVKAAFMQDRNRSLLDGANAENPYQLLLLLPKKIRNSVLASLSSDFSRTGASRVANRPFLFRYYEKAEEGYRVSVVNPRRIKGYASSQLQRTKTDSADAALADAALIARFGRREAPRPWQPPSAAESRLQRQRAGFRSLLEPAKRLKPSA